MRAVIYARYSSDQQREASTAALGPGQPAADAPSQHCGLDRQPRAGAFDVVVSEALDRLSRDQEDVAALYKHLSFAGVKLVTTAEGEINELHVGLKGTMNALYLKDLAEKTRRGLEGRIRQGRS